MCAGERERAAAQKEEMKKRRDFKTSECGRQQNDESFTEVGVESNFNPGWHKTTTPLTYCKDKASFGGDSSGYAQHAFGFTEKYEEEIGVKSILKSDKMNINIFTPTHVSRKKI